MGMAEEGDFARGVQKAVKCLRGCENVFVFILKRAVHQHDAVGCKRAWRQR